MLNPFNILKISFKKVASIFGFSVVGKAAYSSLLGEIRSQSLPRGFLSELLQCRPVTISFFEYGCLCKKDGDLAESVLYLTHDYGLFSCLVTMMWTLLDIQRLGLRAEKIDNSFSMNLYKQAPRSLTWKGLFSCCPVYDVDTFCSVRPISWSRFDAHGEFKDVVNNQLGHDWIKAFLNTYLKPSDAVLHLASSWIEKYSISPDQTIAIYYRGTDKAKEVAPTPLEDYFAAIDSLLFEIPSAKLLIQTDEFDMRQAFVEKYPGRCTYIAELPVTRKLIGIHYDPDLNPDRDRAAIELYAMCLALSTSKVLVTCTSNVGFFIALHGLIKGNRVVQFR